MSGVSLPPDHAERLARARVAVEGLSIGDAFGEQFFVMENISLLDADVSDRPIPPPPWPWTDDTMMALGIHEVLARHGRIDQDDLAQTFVRRYFHDQLLGYGATAHRILHAISTGLHWRQTTKSAFGGEGSMGNGSAMRVAPVGAYFADDLQRVVAEAQASAEVTHFHNEGIAGAIAVAVATAFAWQTRREDDAKLTERFFDTILDLTPASQTAAGIVTARQLPLRSPVDEAARLLGNGARVTCPDTVPLCLWLAARHHRVFVDAMWNTVAAGGDIDTNAAIVGGIVVMATGYESIPKDWLAAREPLMWG